MRRWGKAREWTRGPQVVDRQAELLFALGVELDELQLLLQVHRDGLLTPAELQALDEVREEYGRV